MKSRVVAIVVLALFGAAAPTSASEDRSREAYVRAFLPVVEDEFRHDGLTATDETYECVAEGYVDGFTMRRLRAVGSPKLVAKQRASRSSASRFGLSRSQEGRIVATAVLGCLPIAQILKLGLQAQGKTLSDGSVACLTDRFANDPEAEDAYAEATVRQTLDKDPEFTPALARAGQILGACLTPDELKAIQG